VIDFCMTAFVGFSRRRPLFNFCGRLLQFALILHLILSICNIYAVARPSSTYPIRGSTEGHPVSEVDDRFHPVRTMAETMYARTRGVLAATQVDGHKRVMSSMPPKAGTSSWF